jgi:hypothetical protein
MDPDQPTHLRSLIRIHTVRLQTLLQVEKLIANSMDPDQIGGAGWSGSMQVATPLCWFCRDTAQLSESVINDASCDYKEWHCVQNF